MGVTNNRTNPNDAQYEFVSGGCGVLIFLIGAALFILGVLIATTYPP